jgi:hypothetical protein
VAIALIGSTLAGQNDQVVKLETDLVTIDVTVTDKDGAFIRKVNADDFVVRARSHASRISSQYLKSFAAS